MVAVPFRRRSLHSSESQPTVSSPSIDNNSKNIQAASPSTPKPRRRDSIRSFLSPKSRSPPTERRRSKSPAYIVNTLPWSRTTDATPMRYKEDYITARGANPRTGAISPTSSRNVSIGTGVVRSTSASSIFSTLSGSVSPSPPPTSTPEDSYGFGESPYGSGSRAMRDVTKVALDTASPGSTKLRVRNERNNPAKLASTPEHYSSTRNMPTVDPARRWRKDNNGWIVESKQGSSPKIHKQFTPTPAQVEAYNHYRRKSQRLSTHEYASGFAPYSSYEDIADEYNTTCGTVCGAEPGDYQTHSDQSVNYQAGGFRTSPKKPQEPRVIELDTTPPASPRSEKSVSFSTDNSPSPKRPALLIYRKPVGSSSSIPQLASPMTSVSPLAVSRSSAASHARSMSSPDAVHPGKLSGRQFAAQLASQRSVSSSPPKRKQYAMHLPHHNLNSRAMSLPCEFPAPLRLEQEAHKPWHKSWVILVVKVFLLGYALVCLWSVLDAVRASVVMVLWPVWMLVDLGRWLGGK